MTDTEKAADRLFLLVDDHGRRDRQFTREVAGGNLEVEVVDEAVALKDMRTDLMLFDGAIVDFHLDTPPGSDYTCLQYPCVAEDCPELDATENTSAEYIAYLREEHAWHTTAGIRTVDVTTGLGAMLYIKQHAPDVELYGICALSAKHSIMFLCAAHMWLGASAINADNPSDLIRRALVSPDGENPLPIHNQLRAAAEGFEKLTNSLDFLTRPAEAIDYLGEYMKCGQSGARAELLKILQSRTAERLTLEGDIYVEMVCRWQGALARILTAFGEDVSGWPDLRTVTDARYWNKHNPVLDFLKNKNFQTFFTAADVRAALDYYRANQKRQALEDPLGRY
ncbi:hypothetical protein [Mycolicibacterium vanbaalenii]|uniref:Uncharacterized protein n=1 Tax=Mycolicibacterium vanbaalenii (strain DSM 7251 / JCM 13017 / BCRC 16820 / KCTC 9966 / NRRL B-24157 / PYR-1) TaxID=350058 RepID=A1THW9_MYCVP|nr:hypothetical protein [Mycolicibacterium vanbaalenii]ABM16769.1 hypothetical protein Mvan_6014 [Mycolicibacterium vanbaalenii PYR-1]MCV7126952.1 hypothetical protein [Mycolicibacterium vanbaalenii PYR-1]